MTTVPSSIQDYPGSGDLQLRRLRDLPMGSLELLQAVETYLADFPDQRVERPEVCNCYFYCVVADWVAALTQELRDALQKE